jgi:hypothetical protein
MSWQHKLGTANTRRLVAKNLTRQMYTAMIGLLQNDSLLGNSNHSPCAVLPNRRSRKLCAFPWFPHGRARVARRPAIL